MKAMSSGKSYGKDVDYRVVDRLRQLPFPDCVTACVQYVDAFLYGQQGAIPNETVACHLVDEFIFLSGNKKSKYTGLEELQLQDILLKQLQAQSNLQIRTKFYMLLFSGSENNYKTELQCRLVSLAVATECAKVLDATAEWMKHLNFCGKDCIELTQYVVNDYCRLHPGAAGNLAGLPIVSPQFACSLITALTHVYNSHRDRTDILPPLQLLETIASWVSSDSCLLLATAVPSPVSITNCTETAVPGVINWCILAPILVPHDSDTASRSLALYSRLHFGLLNTILTTANMPHIQKELLSISSIQELCEDILEFIKPVKNVGENEHVRTAVERLAQLIQVSVAAGSLKKDKKQLRKMCAKLPAHKLLDFVLGDETPS